MQSEFNAQWESEKLSTDSKSELVFKSLENLTVFTTFLRGRTQYRQLIQSKRIYNQNRKKILQN